MCANPLTISVCLSLSILDAAENATSKLSNVAIDRIKTAIEAFTTIKRKLVQGDIEIKLLNAIFKQSDAFLELLQIGNMKQRAETDAGTSLM